MKINYIGCNYTHREKFGLKRPNGAASNVFINVKSSAKFVIDKKTLSVEPGSLVIIKKGTPYSYEYNKAYGTDDWFHFELSDEEEKNYPLPYNIVLPLHDTSLISFFISKMQYEFYGQSEHKERKINLYFELLWLEIVERMKFEDLENRQDFSVYNMRAYIYNYPEHRFNNKYYANHVGMSVSHFQRSYEKTFGITPTQDIILSRIERVKYLLKNTNNTVSEIAAELNYKNDVQLFRQFKKITGMTPLEYRKKH